MLIGRESELTAVIRRLTEGRSVVVVGEAGAGKTSLIREAVAVTGGASFEGVGLATLDWLPYLPLSRALGRAVPAEGDRAAIAALVRDEVDDGTLVLDDLHWADSDTLATLEHLSSLNILAAIRVGDPGTDRALTAAEAAGFQQVPLGRLMDSAARELVELANPELTADRVAAVLDRAHGNPLLLEELARAGGEPTATLRITISARLRRFEPPVRDAVARLALLGRPATNAELEADVGPLLDAALVVEAEGRYALRHALLGEAALAELAAEQLASLHSRLARLVEAPGEAARHHYEAGELEQARGAALRAAEQATRPAERARHLALAARCGGVGLDADRLRLRAAAALSEAGEHQSAIDVLELVDSDTPEVRAEVELCLGTATVATEGHATGVEHFDRGLAQVTADRPDLEAALLLERARTLLYAEWGTEAALEAAAVASLRAEQEGLREAEALLVLAMAQYVAGSRECFATAERARAAARAEDDHHSELRAGALLGSAHESFGDSAASYALIGELIERARDLHQLGLEAELLYYRGHLEMLYRGDYPAAIEIYEQILADPAAIGVAAGTSYAMYGLALTDIGRMTDARRVLAEGLARAGNPADRLLLLCHDAERERLAGNPGRAVELGEQALEADPVNPNRAMAWVVLNWARFEAGLEPRREEVEIRYPVTQAVASEVDALIAMAAGRYKEAERGFDDGGGASGNDPSSAVRSAAGRRPAMPRPPPETTNGPESGC